METRIVKIEKGCFRIEKLSRQYNRKTKTYTPMWMEAVDKSFTTKPRAQEWIRKNIR